MRLPAAVLITFAVILIGLALGRVGTFAFADGLPTPSASTIIECRLDPDGNTVACAFAVGVGSMTGSRGVTLTGVIGWQTVATPLLLHVTSLGSARDALQLPAFSQLMPVPGDPGGRDDGGGRRGRRPRCLDGDPDGARIVADGRAGRISASRETHEWVSTPTHK